MSDDQGSAAPTQGKKGCSKVWLILLLVFGLPALVCGGCCVGIFVFMAGMKSTEPYQMALERVTTDPEVIGRLGQPITDDTFPTNSSINVEGASGSASYSFRISGPNGRANVETEAERAGGAWSLTRLTVTFEPEGTTVNLLPGGDDDLEIDFNIDFGPDDDVTDDP